MDNLELFIELRGALQQEQAEISNRLQEIERALGFAGGGSAAQGAASARQTSAPAIQPPRRGRPPGAKGKNKAASAPAAPAQDGRGRRNAKSLKEAVLEALGSGRKTKLEILAAVGKSGYEFTTSNPLNSLGVILYGKKPKFKNNDGYFSAA